MQQRRCSPISLLPCLAVILAVLAPPSCAQTDRATLEGTVTDASGGAISGTRVTSTNTVRGN
jgi:hypothetical protein